MRAKFRLYETPLFLVWAEALVIAGAIFFSAPYVAAAASRLFF